jgi:hypothetical protein
VAAPIRNLGQAETGQVYSTPPSIRRRLAIRLLKVTGVKGVGRRG